MIGGIAFGVTGLHLTVPRLPYLGAQAVIGAMVSAGITADIVGTLSRNALLLSVTQKGWWLFTVKVGIKKSYV